MATDTDDDLDLAAGDAGVAFRAEMWATNTLLGYWKHLVALLVVGLLGFLFYGQYDAWVLRTQRGIAAQIARVETRLPASVAELPLLARAGREGADTETLLAAAAEIEAVGGTASGPGRTEAYLKAAELYRLGGDAEARARCLNAAVEKASGVLAYTAAAALANHELEQGQGDAAVERLRVLMAGEGYLAEQAALDLAHALEHLDRNSEAAEVYAQFLERWPESVRVEEVTERQRRVGSKG